MKREKRKVAVLILSVHQEEIYVLKALRAGASGYLTKESASAELIDAIRKIAAGGKYVSPRLAETVVFGLSGGPPERPRHEALSGRELRVMSMIASGLKPKSIAEQLCLSVKTINSHRARILEKMNIKTNAELVRYVVENKLIE